MILLDTDHLTVLRHRSYSLHAGLVSRLQAANDPRIAATVISLEEQMRGWIASIAKERQSRRQVRAYHRLAGLFEFFRSYHLALFDETAADLYDGFSRIRIGASDRKIAAIAIANNALSLTANRRDYEQVPGLRFENWMD